MATTRPATVEVDTTMRFVAADFSTVNVRASMRYDAADPYAVQVRFHPGNPDAEQVSWSFARELLAIGLVEPTGIGDVRVWPWSTPRGDALALALSSPDGNALFEMSRTLVSRFLKRSYALVPKGSEGDSLDVDTTVVKLLASTDDPALPKVVGPSHEQGQVLSSLNAAVAAAVDWEVRTAPPDR